MPYQQVGTIKLYYEWHGDEQAPPLVCINGLLSDTTSWALQLPDLGTHFRILLYDCRGQGKSDAPTDGYTPEQHVADLVGLLDALHVPAGHMVGLSHGGTIAMKMAIAHPERVRRLVLMNTFAVTDPVMTIKMRSWLAALECGGVLLRFDVAQPWMWGPDFLRDHGDTLASLREIAGQGNPETVRSLINGVMGYDIRADLARIRAPTLVLVGEHDLLTPPSAAQTIAYGIPDAQLFIIPRAGHVLTIERAPVVNALIRTFLNG